MATIKLSTTQRRILGISCFAVVCYGYFWVLALSKAGSISKLFQDEQLLVMVGVVTGLMVATGWSLIYLYMKKMQITLLHQKAKSVLSLRDPTVRLKADKFNDLSSVAGLINSLMDQVDESIETRRSLAELDSLILSGADLTAITRRCLIAAKIDAIDTHLILRAEDETPQLFLHQLDGLKVRKSIVTTLEPSVEALDDPQFFREVAQKQHQDALASYLIACEEQPFGVLYACGDRPLSASESKRLEDLVDRMSVAITNVRRSETLFNQANYDPLTGLVNRRAFEARVGESLQRAKRDETGVVLFMDLDGFKKVNDSAGHEAGDYILTLVAEKLRKVVRPEDTVARLGGDEFAIIAANCSEEKEISDLCNRIIRALTEPVMIDRMEHTIGTSIGVARYPEDGSVIDELVTKADSAMYKAKQEGGSRFAFFDDALKATNDHRVLVESRLRSAIKEGSLALHFQPKLSLKDWRVDSAEALLRWRDPQLGVIGPDEFIGVAEESGLMNDILPVIIQHTSDLLRSADSAGIHLDRIAINASPKQIMTEGFALSVLSQLDGQRIAHERIEVEVTETVFAKDMAQVLTELHILRMAGIKVALDDFGTGYSSLNMLRELPLDIVKIDRAFITELEDSQQARLVLKHLIDIAAVLNLKVVAEGVETDVQLQYLIENNCDYVQGWFIAKAQPAQDFLQFVQEWGPSAPAFRTDNTVAFR